MNLAFISLLKSKIEPTTDDLAAHGLFDCDKKTFAVLDEAKNV
jgi:hypothetical protein